MAIKIGINGFGRIGRMVFRRAILDEQFEVVAINATYPVETLAHLIKYDTIHGSFHAKVEINHGDIVINDTKRVKHLADRNPENLPWQDLGVDVIIEATGKFKDREGASKHLRAGAKKVLITAPGKEEDITIVIGVNEDTYDRHQHHIISNASCTTNCLAPIVKVIDQRFGIENGFMTTVHSYTNDQINLDNPHKDLRRARACAQSIIPTSTGAAKAISKVLPNLQGKLNGVALRVPTPNVSIVDLVVDVQRDVTVDSVNQALKHASIEEMKGIIEYTEEPLVSSDFNGNEHSAIVDALSTMVIGDRKIKLMVWYDNEWGYSCRVVDLARLIGQQLNSN